MESEGITHPPTHTCYHCGGDIFEDPDDGIENGIRTYYFFHCDTDYINGVAIDAHHAAVPTED